MDKKKKGKLIKIIAFIFYMIIGFATGYLMAKLEIENIFLSIIFSVVNIVMALYLSIIIHEGGHLIFGLLSGYKFVSFRVGSLILIKNQNGYKFKKYGIVGTGGQCLLAPPEVDENYNFPYLMYNLGGGVLNIIAGLIFLVLSFITKNLYAEIFLQYMFILGIFLGLLNLIPMESTVSNDGDNIRQLKKDKNTRRALWLQLSLNKGLIYGKRIKDMDESWFDVEDGADLNNNLIATMVVNKASYYLDRHEFDKAKEHISYLLDGNISLMEIFKYELESIKGLIACIELDEYTVRDLYKDKLKKYIKQAKNFSPDKRTFLYAYNLLIEKDDKKAMKELKLINKMNRKYPYQGEIELNNELIEIINVKKEELNY